MNAKKRGGATAAKNDPKVKTGAARAAKSAGKTAVATKAGDAVEAVSTAKTGAAVKISAAKGRPMLTWVGKRSLAHVTAFPAQHVETYSPSQGKAGGLDNRWADWPAAYPKGGLLFHGDNKEVLAHLLANGFRGKVKLIYIDPPFDSGADYVRKVSLRGPKGTAKIDGETYALGEQIQYTDIWANDNYLQFMFERLLLLREFLSPDGGLYLHCDTAKGHFLRAILDEVFGPEAFIHEVIWYYSNKITDSQKRIFQRSHDSIIGYSKSNDYEWHTPFEKRPETVRNKKVIKVDGRRVNARDENGKLIYVETDVKAMLDVWDIPIIGSRAEERMEYPTQKPEAILRRLIEAHTSPIDLVLDSFIGSGTTAAVAQKLGRRWIGCDINKGAIQTTAKRLQGIIAEQIEAVSKETKQGKLDLAAPLSRPSPIEEEGVLPAQLLFGVWRVNDYDLAIQHNEAVNLACEHIGIERTRADGFFDGTLGKMLAKIIPFGHPLSPLDLEEIRKELEARPEEDRPVTVVCLGKELGADAWLEDWNRLRKGRDAVNRIAVIELRTDPKYGKFIEHKPARARVKVAHKKDTLTVGIMDFISPAILERLESQAGILKPKIDDFRAMIDCVMIDPAWDGKVFNVALSDVPERRPI